MRYQLTQADRRKGGKAKYAKYGHTGHKLTRVDRQLGGRNQPLEAKRRGGLATAAKRRAQRERNLLALALPAKRGSESPSEPDLGFDSPLWDVEPAQRGSQSPGEPAAPITDEALANVQVLTERITIPTGPELASKLLAGEGAEITNICTDGGREENQRPEPEPVDPFTLSALKRFRLGPLSPLALTRSQRAQVDVMVKDGWLEADSVSMLRLTEKGRQAIEGSES